MPSVHRIRRLRCRVLVAGSDRAFAARAQLRRLAETSLIDEIGRAFDAVAPAGAVVHLPRLELSVRLSDLDDLPEAVVASVREQARWWPEAPAPRAASQAHAAEPRIETPRTPAPRHALDALIAYLETGALPWHVAHRDRDETRAQLAAAALAEPARVLTAVPRSLGVAASFVFRWLQLLPEAEWPIVAGAVDDAGSDARGVEAAVAALIATKSGLSPPARHYAATILLAVATSRRARIAVSPADVAGLLDAAPMLLTRRASDDVLPMTGVPAAARDWLAARLAPREDVRTARERSAMPAEGRSAAGGVALPHPAGHPYASPAVRVPASRGDVTADDPKGVSVQHAGLVLLHPFLPTFFARTGVIGRGAKAIPTEALSRAAALLAFTARGEDSPVAFELGFAKVLLGLRPDDELQVPAGLLGRSDTDEVDALLASVVDHWKVLKHTSIAGLRRSFLQRRGLVTDADGAWRLHVEPDAFDVLLQQLPWGLGLVVLPWTTRPLYVEWTTP